MSEKVLKGVNIMTHDGIRNADITIENGIIGKIEYRNEKSNLFAIPGFIDTHIHGFSGAGTDDGSADSILRMSERLIDYGVTSFFPTIYTDTLEKMERDIIAVREASGNEKGAKIRGIHIEGPFISPKRIGAQNPEGRKDPDAELFLHLVNLAPGLVKAMTVAPELKGMEDVAEEARKMGVILLAGHTDATFSDIKRGAELGIRHATHLFNAMKGLHHREPGTVGGVFMLDEMTTEIIADGLHVHPEVVKLTVKVKGPDNVIAITDSLTPTEQKREPFLANGVPVVLKDGLWVTKGREDLIQGSSLTMYKAYTNLLEWGFTRDNAMKMTSANAARVYSLDDTGRIEVGKKADIIIMDEKNSISEVIRG